MRGALVLGVVLLGVGGCSSKATHGLTLEDGGRDAGTGDTLPAAGDTGAAADHGGAETDGAATDATSDVCTDCNADGATDASADVTTATDGPRQRDAEVEAGACDICHGCCSDCVLCAADSQCWYCLFSVDPPALCNSNQHYRDFRCCAGYYPLCDP